MIYPYKCDRCGSKIDRVCSLREYEANPVHLCFTCQEPMRRIICAPTALVNTRVFEAFKSPVDGSIITNSAELREHNKRNNVVQLHEGYDEKGVQNLTKIDYQAAKDAETAKDLRDDMQKAVTKLEQGYKPAPPPESEIIPHEQRSDLD